MPALLRQIESDRALNGAAISALGTLMTLKSAPEEGLAYWALNPHLRRDGNRLTLTRPNPEGAAAAMIVELLDWRAATLPESIAREAAAPFTGAGPVLWREYLREAIPPLFGATINPGNWNSGIVRLGRNLILLTMLKKGGLATGNHYQDRFLSSGRMQWQSQTQTQRDSQIGRMLSGQEPGAQVHLFVRSGKLRRGKAAPFLYCGQPTFVSWEGEKPITVAWQLPAQVPIHLRPGLGIV